jgi:hypothetical protein
MKKFLQKIKPSTKLGYLAIFLLFLSIIGHFLITIYMSPPPLYFLWLGVIAISIYTIDLSREI